ncbi:parthenolide synthase [Artemisia annua]|uniref:Parthenolide synthase n=1 Tax=Artemisia annua TaxID=35608 RepID=A0A2U1KMP3_ARTAN|nr:parthenolide synthase [Artemisia annua]
MLINAGAKPFLVVSSSDIAVEILKTQHNIFATRASNKGTKRISYNFLDVTFSPHGNHWREMRKVFVTEYLGSKRAGRFNQLLRMEIDGLNNILSSNPLNTQVNLNDMFLALVYGVVGKFAFGKSYKEDPFNGVTLKEVIDETMTMFAGSAADVFPTYGLIVYMLSGWNGRLEKCFGYLDGYFQTIMDEHFETLKEVSEDEKDYAHSLVQLSLEDPRFTEIHIKALLIVQDRRVQGPLL